jgi:hypothetical protein
MRSRQSAFKLPTKSLDERDFIQRADGPEPGGDDEDIQDEVKPKVCFSSQYFVDPNVLSRSCHRRVTLYITFTRKWIAMTKEKSDSLETGTSSVSTEIGVSLQSPRR